jgi:glycine cleavage system transcriptional repressor
MAHAILTAIGVDRAGLVDEVSQFIYAGGGNIEDSRMVNLRGQFVMVVLLAGDEATIGKLRHDQGRLAQTSGLQVELRPMPTPPTGATAVAPGALPFRFVATAVDRPGIVHEVSHLLREMSVNIESLETRVSPAPYTGSPVFEMEAVLSAPGRTPVNELRKRLGALCDQMNVDWELTRA